MVGKRFRECVRLAITAATNWTRLDGEHAGRGIRILALPLPSFFNVIHTWAMALQSDEEARKWAEKLNDPLPGEERDYEMEADETAQLGNI